MKSLMIKYSFLLSIFVIVIMKDAQVVVAFEDDGILLETSFFFYN
jgi:hypothetical protein